VAIGLLVVGTTLGLFVGLALWSRIPAWAAYGAVALLGAMLGTGALMLQDDPGAADWVVVLGVTLALTPVYCRFLFGEPGGSRQARVVAAEWNDA
jgi:hypothetical protein